MTDAYPEPRRRGRPPNPPQQPEFASVEHLVGIMVDEPVGPPTPQKPAPTVSDGPVQADGFKQGWYTIDSAPDDGKLIWIAGPFPEPVGTEKTEAPVVEGYWRHTRTWDKNGGKWRITGFWASTNPRDHKIPFEAVAWRPR